MPGMVRDQSSRALAIGGLLLAVALGIGSLGRPVVGFVTAIVGGVVLTTRRPNSSGTAPRPIADGGRPDIEMVVAIIRPGKLNDVKRALAEAGAPSLTVTNVSGRGTQPTETGQWRGDDYVVDLHQKVKIECAVTDDRTEGVIDAIQEAAHTGKPGDGKIFVEPVLDACRVSTDERGIEAM